MRFKAELHRGGIGYYEMIKLIENYPYYNNWEEFKQVVKSDNLLGKSSDSTVNDLLRAFKIRFLSQKTLPKVVFLSNFIKRNTNSKVKMQVILPYYLYADSLLSTCYKDLFLKRINLSEPNLKKSEVLDYLRALETKHPEISTWSEYLKEKWARAFLTFLRRFGLMENHPSSVLHPLWIMPETFGFFWLWIWEKSKSFRRTRENKIWYLLQVDQERLENLLLEGQIRGWWNYQVTGNIVNFRSFYKDCSDWIQHGLE